MPQAGATGEARAGEEEKAMERVDRRAAAWPDFLRRMLLGASLASSAATMTALPEESPPAEVADAEAPGDPARSSTRQA